MRPLSLHLPVDRYGPVTRASATFEVEEALERLERVSRDSGALDMTALKSLAALQQAGLGLSDKDGSGTLAQMRSSLWDLRCWFTDHESQHLTPKLRRTFEEARSACFDVSWLRPSSVYPNQKATERPAIWAIPNFFEVAPGVFRGGQLTQAGVTYLKEHGFRGDIDLRGSDADNTWIGPMWEGADHLSLPIEDLGMPTLPQILQFKAYVEQPGHLPVILHCKAGVGRTSAMLACWMITRGVGADEAMAQQCLLGGAESVKQADGIRQFEKDWLATHPPA